MRHTVEKIKKCNFCHQKHHFPQKKVFPRKQNFRTLLRERKKDRKNTCPPFPLFFKATISLKSMPFFLSLLRGKEGDGGGDAFLLLLFPFLPPPPPPFFFLHFQESASLFILSPLRQGRPAKEEEEGAKTLSKPKYEGTVVLYVLYTFDM